MTTFHEKIKSIRDDMQKWLCMEVNRSTADAADAKGISKETAKGEQIEISSLVTKKIQCVAIARGKLKELIKSLNKSDKVSSDLAAIRAARKKPQEEIEKLDRAEKELLESVAPQTLRLFDRSTTTASSNAPQMNTNGQQQFRS